jgi:hypothetical protein
MAIVGDDGPAGGDAADLSDDGIHTLPDDGSRPAASRLIEVAPDRLPRWIGSFADRHGALAGRAEPAVVTFHAADGWVARCDVPFPPLAGTADGDPGEWTGLAGRLAAHAVADRTVGVLLVRLGGYAAGVFTGPGPALAASKVGSRLVHGRSAAGGQSQRRFARRREKQAREALEAAADTAVAVFESFARQLDAVVLGGDRRAVAALRADARLARYFGLATDRFLTVPDPRLAVLRDTPRRFRAITIRLTGPR